MAEKRNYGLDLLRVLSMGGIVGLHVLNAGGVLASTQPGTIQYILAWLAEIALYCSTSTFAMLTGYLYAKKEPQLLRSEPILKLLLTAAFWCVLLLAGACCLFPELLTGWRSYLVILFPPISGGKTGGYWYLTCYVFMFFMIPYLNRLLQSMTQKQTRVLLLLLFFFFCLASTLGLRDYFHINEGYSPFWLMFCYLTGAYISRYGFTRFFKKRILLLLYFGNVLLMFALKLAIRAITNRLLGSPFAENIFITYVSPFVFANSVLLLLAFRDIVVRRGWLQKLLLSASAAAFSVYIIHCNPLIFDNWLTGGFAFMASLSWPLLLGLIVAVPIGFYLVGWAAELIRAPLFKLLRIDQLACAAGKALDKYIRW